MEKGRRNSDGSAGLCLFDANAGLSDCNFFSDVFSVLDRRGTKMVVGSGFILIHHIGIPSGLFGLAELPVPQGVLGILGEKNGGL